MIILRSKTSTKLAKELAILFMRIINTTSKTIRDVIKLKNKTKNNSNAAVYQIKCPKCNNIYIGDTSRDLKPGIQKYKRDLWLDTHSNSIVLHRKDVRHNFNFTNASHIKTNITI